VFCFDSEVSLRFTLCRRTGFMEGHRNRAIS
jgi:hypothetical protein